TWMGFTYGERTSSASDTHENKSSARIVPGRRGENSKPDPPLPRLLHEHHRQYSAGQHRNREAEQRGEGKAAGDEAAEEGADGHHQGGGGVEHGDAHGQVVARAELHDDVLVGVLEAALSRT